MRHVSVVSVLVLTSLGNGQEACRGNRALETAQKIAAHESPRSTRLYDRRDEELSLGDVERIAI